MFDIRNYLQKFNCSHTSGSKVPAPFVAFPFVHSVFLAEAGKVIEIVKPLPSKLTSDSILEQINQLSTNLEVERMEK